MQPAHMATGIMKSHIVIQSGINTAGTQSVGNRPNTEHPKGIAEGKAQQCNGGHGHAERGDLSGPQTVGQVFTEQAGCYRAGANDH